MLVELALFAVKLKGGPPGTKKEITYNFCFQDNPIQNEVNPRIMFLQTDLIRACLYGGGGPQIGEVTCDVSPHLSCKRDQIKMRDYKRVSMRWLLLRLSAYILALLRLSVNLLQLRLTKKLKINLFCFKELNINILLKNFNI